MERSSSRSAALPSSAGLTRWHIKKRPRGNRSHHPIDTGVSTHFPLARADALGPLEEPGSGVAQQQHGKPIAGGTELRPAGIGRAGEQSVFVALRFCRVLLLAPANEPPALKFQHFKT